MNQRQLLLFIPLFLVGLLVGGISMSVLQKPDTKPVSLDSLASNLAMLGPASIESPVESSSGFGLVQFEAFVPANANLFIVGRPRQFCNSEFGKPLLERLGVPFARMFKNIELVIVASTEESLDNAVSYRMRRSFEDIAYQLRVDKSVPKPKKLHAKTLVNYLNQDFCGMIRFKNKTGWEQFRSWFHDDKEFKGKYFESKWNGYHVLECKEKDTCVVRQMDERTYLIGNKTELENGIESSETDNVQVSNWITQSKIASFAGELLIAADGDTIKKQSGLAFVVEEFGKIEDSVIAFDLGSEQVFNCELNFESSNGATDFMTKSRETLDMVIDTYDENLGFVEGDGDLWAWQMNKVLEVMKATEIETAGTTGTVSIRRPAGFGDWPKQYSKRAKAFEKAQQKFATQQSRQPAVKMGAVLVARKDIKRGATIRASDLTIENWPVQIIPDDALSSKEAAHNKKAKHSMRKGMPMTKHSFVRQGRD